MENKVTHKPDCKRVFSRYDASCPRCAELTAGGAARKGWGDSRRQQDAQRSAAISRFFAPGGEYSRMTPTQQMCCTKFEW